MIWNSNSQITQYHCDFLCRLKTVQAKLEDSIKEAEEEMKQYAT